MKSNNLINLFPKPIINLLGGEDKFIKYPIIEIPFKIDAPISIGVINDCPFFVLRINYRNKEYKEIFKQKSINNMEIWECSSHSYIFSNSEYNIYYEDKYGKNDLKNIENLVNGNNSVSIHNFTNDLRYGYDFINETALLI